jgi:hypothetical protein
MRSIGHANNSAFHDAYPDRDSNANTKSYSTI